MSRITSLWMLAVALLGGGCDTTSECQKVDREFERVVSQREVQVVDASATIEAHFRLDQIQRSLLNQLRPALVASLPDPPESGFDLKIEDAELAVPEDCPRCFRLTGKLVGEAAADGVDLDVVSGTVDLLFDVGEAQRGTVFIPARPAEVSLGEVKRMREPWRKTFEEALVEQFDVIRPRPAVLRLPPTLDGLRTQILVQNDGLSLIYSKSGDAEPRHPDETLWVNPRHLQRVVESTLEVEPRVAAGTLVRAGDQVAIPVRFFGRAPRCRIDTAELVLDLERDEIGSSPAFIDRERAREVLRMLRLLEPDALVLQPPQRNDS